MMTVFLVNQRMAVCWLHSPVAASPETCAHPWIPTHGDAGPHQGSAASPQQCFNDGDAFCGSLQPLKGRQHQHSETQLVPGSTPRIHISPNHSRNVAHRVALVQGFLHSFQFRVLLLLLLQSANLQQWQWLKWCLPLYICRPLTGKKRLCIKDAWLAEYDIKWSPVGSWQSCAVLNQLVISESIYYNC